MVRMGSHRKDGPWDVEKESNQLSIPKVLLRMGPGALPDSVDLIYTVHCILLFLSGRVQAQEWSI